MGILCRTLLPESQVVDGNVVNRLEVLREEL